MTCLTLSERRPFLLNVSNPSMLLERLVLGAKPSASNWQDHKKKVMLAMLEELPKWVKMTNPTANDAKAAAAAAAAATAAADKPDTPLTGPSPAEARALFSTKSFGHSIKSVFAPPASAAPLSHAWNMVHYLAELEQGLKRAAEAAATQLDKNPAKDTRRGLLAMLMPMQWKRAHASRAAADDGSRPPDSQVGALAWGLGPSPPGVQE